MSRISPVRFVGLFHDRDRTPFDVDSDGEVFFSLRDARDRFRERVASGSWPSRVVEPVRYDDGLVATHLYKETSEMFLVTEDAYIDLFFVIPDSDHTGWGVVAGDPSYRLELGPNLGVHVERY